MEKFGKYLLLEKLASGGMAEVFLAKSMGASGISKFVAIKKILPQYSENAEFIDMFKDEAKIAVNLNHSNVVSIFDFGIEKSQFFLVMEYVEGKNLRQMLNHMKKSNLSFTIDQIVYMIKEVAAGLDHAHRCMDGATGKPLNIIHRDMSPQNIMVSFEGEIKIIDFGIAKAESQIENTKAGTLKGKFGYMSPEQAEGLPVDLRTDVFSLGIVLWELLANDRLFTANNELNTLRKIRDCHVPSLKRINPNIPAELERICNKALAKDRNLRYQNSAALQKDLSRFLNLEYPEFSPHEFSVFAKSLYSDVVLENRKKLIEYAKVPLSAVEEAGKRAVSDKTEVTLTLTGNNKPQVNGPQINNPVEDMLTDVKAVHEVDLKSLRKGSDEDFRRKIQQEHTLSHTLTRSSIGRTQTKNQKTSSYSWVMFLLAFVVFAAGSGLFYQRWQRNQSQSIEVTQLSPSIPLQPTSPTAGNSTASVPSEKPLEAPPSAQEPPIESQEFGSVGTYMVTVRSEPSGAEILIDGEIKGSTPAQIQIEAHKEHILSLRKEGYFTYQQTVVASENTSLAKISLLKTPTGYVDIDVINGSGANLVITINGLRINQSLPIRNYAVPADTKIVVKATNPFLKTTDTQEITVAPDNKKSVNMILK